MTLQLKLSDDQKVHVGDTGVDLLFDLVNVAEDGTPSPVDLSSFVSGTVRVTSPANVSTDYAATVDGSPSDGRLKGTAGAIFTEAGTWRRQAVSVDLGGGKVLSSETLCFEVEANLPAPP